MGKSSTFINSEEPQKENPSPVEEIKDVYIGVFFDGTSNNMRYISKTATKKGDREVASLKKVLQDIQKEKDNFRKSGSDFSNLFDNIPETPSNVNDIKENDILFNIAEEYIAASEVYKLSEIKGNKTGTSDDSMHMSKYSNIAFLTSLYQGTNIKENCKVYNIYIEGSGATEFNTDSGGNDDKAGLAFGLGKTGVVALVSRAIRLVTNYLLSLNLDKQNINIHFDVFGFSRGATCARLFSYLVARGKDEVLPREKEFRNYLPSNYFVGLQEEKHDWDWYKNKNWREKNISSKDDRLKFLEDYNPQNVNVAFLGIYDTVASIGFLKLDNKDEYHKSFKKNDDKDSASSKDGYVNYIYPVLATTNEDYRNNFHCDNVTNYGLYSPQLDRVKYTFHIGAMDEYRENFAFTDCGKTLPSNCVEILMPGSHSDIGGGHLKGDVNHVTLFIKKDLPIFSKTIELPFKDECQIDITTLKPTSHILSNFMNGNGEIISFNILKSLGWIHSFKENKPKGLYYETENGDKTLYGVDFWSSPKVGYKYSNITLQMMIKRAMEVTNRNMFDIELSTQECHHPRIAIPQELNDYAKAIFQLNLEDGKRYCILPGNDYTSNEYSFIRSEFLHFTCTDLWNFNFIDKEEKKKNNYGNVLGANAPYRDDYKICRIAYHGDKGDNKLNDMHFLAKDKIININIKVNV